MKRIYDLKSEKIKTKYFSVREFVALFLIILLIVVIILLITLNHKKSEKSDTLPESICDEKNEKIIENHSDMDMYFERRKNISMSELGKVLFFNSVFEKRSKTFKILIWKDGKFLERRHMKFFTSEMRDPFEKCSVNNCEITYEENELNTADAVVFLLKRINGTQSLPMTRNTNQRWIFLTDESPWNTFMYKDLNDWRNFSGMFNWSMSYRMESDVPVPYGRTVLISENQKDKLITESKLEDKRRDILLATLMNDCPKERVRTIYINELQKYLKVDIYGECGEELKTACSRHFSADCKPLNNYLFYLAFENSNCEEYMTDLIFWNALEKGAIPIIMGPSIENCETFLPPHSFLHTENFKSPKDLADHLLKLNETFDDILEFQKWRKKYAILNEHGYHGTRSFHYCRICEALNYNSEERKVYDVNDLSFYLSSEKNCRNLVL